VTTLRQHGPLREELLILRLTRQCISHLLQWLSPHLHYWIFSAYQPARASLFVWRHPKVVRAGPRIILVAGEDGADKLGPYTGIYSVYLALRPHFDVQLSVHVSFTSRHAARIAAASPDLLLLGSDTGEWQSVFEGHKTPFMGSSSGICRLCFDKAAAKARAARLDITTPAWTTLRKGGPIDEVSRRLRLPLVVKPLRSGRSRGLTKVVRFENFDRAVKRALSWDSEVLVEEYAPGREYTCTVYGNEDPRTLPLNRKIMQFEREEMEARGEKILKSRFPIHSDDPLVAEIQDRSKQIYREFQCRDMVRVDWKYDHATQTLWFLEINALPWMGKVGGNIAECATRAGSSYEEFVVSLFQDALRRHKGA